MRRYCSETTVKQYLIDITVFKKERKTYVM